MVRRERREIKERLAELFTLLLKWQHLPGLQCASQTCTVHLKRWELVTYLTDSPSLCRLLDEPSQFRADFAQLTSERYQLGAREPGIPQHAGRAP
jgi:hypothetical protein